MFVALASAGNRDSRHFLSGSPNFQPCSTTLRIKPFTTDSKEELIELLNLYEVSFDETRLWN